MVWPALVVAFYPGCKEELKRGYQPVAPLLVLLGEEDDWTPPEPCKSMAEESAAPRPKVVLYLASYHGFDSESPVRLRSDVPNGINPGQEAFMWEAMRTREDCHANACWSFLQQLNEK